MPSVEQLGAGWYKVLEPVFSTSWWKTLHKKVWAAAPNIRPEPKNIFRAFRETPFEDVKVVILAQDPYPAGGYADGMAFSSGNGALPKSLEYIYREVELEYGARPKKYSLEPWAHQGVLLLNSSLTVTTGQAGSHEDYGWSNFVEVVLQELSKGKDRLIVVAWGTPAQKLVQEAFASMGRQEAKNIDLITGVHPIAESYSNGRMKFVGGNYFKRINQLLEKQGKEPIEWIF